MTGLRVVLTAAVMTALVACSEDEQQAAKTAPASATVAEEKNASVTQVPAILDISEREYGDQNAITLLFNQPLAADQSFTRYIDISPSLPSPVLSENGRELYFTGLTPEQSYHITVHSGLQMQSGKTLDTGKGLALKARALPEMVAFEEDGVVMVPGQVNDLSLVAVNLFEADIDLYKVRPDQLVNFFDEYDNLKRDRRWSFDEARLQQTLQHHYSARLKFADKLNQRNRSRFSLAHVPDMDQGGVYLATVRAPGGLSFQATWFSVSGLGIQARNYGESSRFIVQNAADGALQSKVELSILDHNNQVIDSGVTDAQGAWETDNQWRRQRPRLILARSANQVTVLKYYAPEFDLSAFDVAGRPARAIEHYLYSPRDIYRPGEELIVSSLIRNHDGQLISGPLTVQLLKPNGDKAGEWRLEESHPGYYEFRHALAQAAELGQWQVKVFNPGQPDNVSWFRFSVEEFLPERMRLTLNQGGAELPAFAAGETVRLNVKGEYLYGAPAAGNRLDTQVTVSGWATPFADYPGYILGDAKAVDWRQFSLASAQLDDEGETRTEINPERYDFSHLNSPARMRLGYSLFESGGRTVDRSQSVLLWPKVSFIGIKPLFEDDQSMADKPAEFNLLRFNAQGQPLAEGQAKVTLYRLEEKYFWSHTPERGWHYQIEKNEYPVANEVVAFAEQPQALNLPVEWGRYRLEVDDLTADSKSVYHFQAGDNWRYAWGNASDQIRPDRVTVALDKSAYKAGESVRVKLASPTAGKAIVLLETDRVLQTVAVDLVERQAEVSLQIPDGLDRHDAYISAFVIAPSEQKDKVSKRSFGITHLPLQRQQRQLQVEIEAAEKYLPEHPARVTVKVTDSQGNPVNGDVFVTLSAVDSGVLSVTGYKPEDPFQFFYGKRAYRARITDMYDDLAEPTLYDQAQVRWGGDAELERGGEAPPSDVQIVSLFQSPVSVVDGTAEIELPLPVFDGELSLHALAMAADRFGADTETTKVATPVVAQLSAPRFMALEDQASLALDLSNVSGASQPLSVSVEATGAVTLDNQDFALTLAEGERQILTLNAHAVALGEGQITARIELRDEQGEPLLLKRHWTLGVRAAYPAVYGQQTELLQPGASFTFPHAQLAELQADSIAAHLQVSVLPELGAAQHFAALMRYPYQCLEQTTSRVQPLALMLDNEKHPSFMAQHFTEENKDQQIQQQLANALSRYSELQLANGGFGLWHKHSPEEQWLTAYVADLLQQLQRSGVTLPEGMLTRANQRLQAYVRARSLSVGHRWSALPQHYEIAYKAYAAYVLAEQSAITLGPLRDLAERSLDNASGPLPGVHLGLAMIASGSVDEGQKLILAALDNPRAPGYLGDYGSTIRDRAMAVATILGRPNLPEAVTAAALKQLPALLQDYQQKSWLSTQEKAALLQLANQLYQLKGDAPWQGELVIAGETIQLNALTGLGQRLEEETLDQSQFRNRHSAPLFATFSWSGLPAEIPEQVAQGIKVQAEHFTLKNGQAEQLQANALVAVGDMILTRVRVYAEEQVPDALIVGLLPAGVELENQNLQNRVKLEDLRIEGEPLQQQINLDYQAFRDDRYVAAVKLPKQRQQTLYYLSRAVTPGRFAVPPVQVESMYQPALRGTSNSIKTLSVTR